MRLLLRLVSVTLWLFLVVPARAGPAPQYWLTDLGDAKAMALAKDGTTVVGLQPFTTEAYTVQLAPTYAVLPRFYPVGVHGHTVVGDNRVLSLTTTHALRVEGQTVHDLGAFAPELFSSATSVNALGDIGGYAIPPDATDAAPVLYLAGTTLVELPTLGPSRRGYVNALNGAGDAAGNSQTSAGFWHCTLWTLEGEAVDCHPGGGGLESYGHDINNAGQIVGFAYPENSGSRGFMGHFMLAPLAGDTHSVAWKINNTADVVGRSCVYPTPTGTCRATMWTNGLPVNLIPRVVNAAGWTLEEARGINEDGLIIGWGTLHGQPRSFALTPIETAEQVAVRQWHANIRTYYEYWTDQQRLWFVQLHQVRR